MSPTERIAMLTSTMNDVSGYQVTSVLGEVAVERPVANVGSR